MYLEFENESLIDDDFPNNKPGVEKGARWYTRRQGCLMFQEGSRWPEKFELTLSFSSSREDQQSVSAISAGKYELSDSAFGFDNRRNPVVDFTKLKPLVYQNAEVVPEVVSEEKKTTAKKGSLFNTSQSKIEK